MIFKICNIPFITKTNKTNYFKHGFLLKVEIIKVLHFVLTCCALYCALLLYSLVGYYDWHEFLLSNHITQLESLREGKNVHFYVSVCFCAKCYNIYKQVVFDC